jgi:hypothetical protein
MSDLDLDSHELLEALRHDEAEAGARERVRARLAAAGALGATSAAASLAAAQSSGTLAKLGVFGVGKLLAVGTGVVALGTAAVLTMSAPAPAPASKPAQRAQRAVVSSPPVVRSLEPAIQPAPVPEARAPAPLPPPTARARTPRRVNVTEALPPPPAAPASTLSDESALLGRAVQALHAGQREAARALLEEHAQRFPDGTLARERQRAFSRLAGANDP